MTPRLIRPDEYEARYPGILAAMQASSLRSAAAQFGLPLGTVLRIAKRLGIKKPLGRTPRVSAPKAPEAT